mmetsp:Transcript_82861/g.208749  ORF Transcript_82861/g.208749 Transcript_82861/m.208749 type:complete len:200 (-) Transcript_82861:969-1568(-)
MSSTKGSMARTAFLDMVRASGSRLKALSRSLTSTPAILMGGAPSRRAASSHDISPCQPSRTRFSIICLYCASTSRGMPDWPAKSGSTLWLAFCAYTTAVGASPPLTKSMKYSPFQDLRVPAEPPSGTTSKGKSASESCLMSLQNWSALQLSMFFSTTYICNWSRLSSWSSTPKMIPNSPKEFRQKRISSSLSMIRIAPS